jgi:hypothetical protein
VIGRGENSLPNKSSYAKTSKIPLGIIRKVAFQPTSMYPKHQNSNGHPQKCRFPTHLHIHQPSNCPYFHKYANNSKVPNLAKTSNENWPSNFAGPYFPSMPKIAKCPN